MKTVGFSETIAACDLKVSSRCRQTTELMKVCELLRSKSLLDFDQMSFTYDI